MDYLSKLSEGLQIFIGLLTAIIMLGGYAISILEPYVKRNRAIAKVVHSIEAGLHPADALLHASITASDCVKSKKLPSITSLESFKK